MYPQFITINSIYLVICEEVGKGGRQFAEDTSSKHRGMGSRCAMPPGPKLKKRGVLICTPPKFGPIWGQLPIFEF